MSLPRAIVSLQEHHSGERGWQDVPRGVYKRTPEMLENYSRGWTPERRKKAAEALAERNRATPMSEETRRKKSEALKGKPLSEQRKASMRAAWTPERRRARSEAYTGKYHGTAASGSFVNAEGYRVLTGHADHPMAYSTGSVLEHRKVLFDALGYGEHPCHWCGKQMAWDVIQADHVNGDKLNNSQENLVPSCQSCNNRRRFAGNPAEWRP